MIEIFNLKKSYKQDVILDISHFQILKGKSYLLIGENGSGKSTLIKLLLGFIKPQFGEIKKANIKIAYAPEKTIYPEFITTKSFLDNILLIRNESSNKLDDVLEKWKIDANKKINHLSKGMKQKLNLIQALLTSADLYIFDEPVNGLDKASQTLFFTEVEKLNNANKTIIVATHYPESYQMQFKTIVTIKDGELYETN